tara:strand:+ start:2781 stop:4736 length:1956 start_codon:yes stop_codon:yes gene_type:complete
MASATLEMILKLSGVDKTSRGLDKVSKSAKDLDDTVNHSTKSNQRFGQSMSGLGKVAVAGGAIFAGKVLFDFSKQAVNAAVAADEAAAAFGTTFGSAAERATQFLEGFANKAGLTVGEAQQLQATLGAVAQGIGFTQEESADLSIELTKIAADVASFSNISAGAEPVLQAFRSALVGEREALKTYGIAITEAEVQTKAFEQTGKLNADQLTRQEKAFATLALIQQKAAVQIGDLDRTLESFANQSRAAGAELRELKEEIGAELIPALQEMLPAFRELVDDVSPSVVNAFRIIAEGVTNLFLALDRLGDTDEGVIFLIRNFSKLADEQRELNEVQKFLNRTTTETIVKAALLSKRSQQLRQQTLLQRVEFEKNAVVLKKQAIPALQKYLEFVQLLTGDEDDLTDSELGLQDAKDRVSEATRKEALATAEERLQKKELQAQIQELLFFQEKGVNVSEELAVAQEKLRLVEFELTRESQELRDAKNELADIEEQLKEKVDSSTDKLADQAETYLKLNERVEIFKELAADKEFMKIAQESDTSNGFLAIGLDLLSQLAGVQGLDQRATELERFADAAQRLQDGAPNVPRVTVPTPSIVTDSSTLRADQALRDIANNIEVNVQIGDESIEDLVVTTSKKAEDKSAFFSRLVASGAE